MTGYDSSEDQRPLTYVNGHAVYATTLLVVIHVVTMVVVTLAGVFGFGDQLKGFANNHVFPTWSLWLYVTYAFVNKATLWFAIEMLLLFRFGRDVEQFLGRRSFLKLYFLLLLTIPLALSIVGFFTPVGEGAQRPFYWGSGVLHFAVFVAFAAIYPGLPMLFGLTAKWVAVILFAIYTLEGLNANAQSPNVLSSLVGLWSSTAVAVLYIFHERGYFSLPSFRFWKKQPQFYVVREEQTRQIRRTLPEEDAIESIDPLLEKISRSGLASLTRSERARLEKGREALLKKESQPR